MKHIRLLLFSLLIIVVSCQNDLKTGEKATLSISPSSAQINANGGLIMLNITSNSDWTIETSSSWCDVKINSGTGNLPVQIIVSENLSLEGRTAIIYVKQENSPGVSLTIVQGLETAYALPIIFHVLSNGTSNSAHNITTAQLNTIVSASNSMLTTNATGISVQLAATNPSGATMAEPGINRITDWSTPVMDAMVFMDSEDDDKNMSMMWALESYINIFLFEFTEEDLAGAAYMPYTTSDNPLVGLEEVSPFVTTANLRYPHCMVLNNKYINNTDEAVMLFVHELGHYLSLHHTFPEDENGFADACYNSDYCSDTQDYNRVKYETWLDANSNLTYAETLKRINCSGVEFTSDNVMDYDFGLANKLTPQQIARIQHVLKYSPLLPSLTNKTKTGRIKGKMDLPRRVMK